jgi:hypothetical protein
MPLVKVIRAFYIEGKCQDIGTTIDVAKDLARELIAVGKAEPAENIPPESGPITTESTPALAGKKWKGK